MKQLYKSFILCALFIATTIASNAQITVDATLGNPSGSYATLKTAFDSINTGYHQGDISIKVHSNTTETANARIDSSGTITGANYTSISIMPADTATEVKTISTSTAGIILFYLFGADNVKVDGRPMGIGSSKFLKFEHTAITNTSSVTLRLINGASNCSFRYVSFHNATKVLAGGFNVSLSTSAATTGNRNDTFEYCHIQGGRTAFSAAGTLANFMREICFRYNTLTEYAFQGAIFSAVREATIDSNSFFFTTSSPTNPSGIIITANIDSALFSVTRNRIYDLFTSAAVSVTGISVTSSAASPTRNPEINVFNNFIALTQPNTTATSVVGFTFAGTQPSICRFINNSVRLGGTHVGGTAGTVVSIGINKSNSNALSTWVCRNNISINNRTGGTTGLFHTAAWVSGNGTSLVGTYDIDYNIYWATGGAGSGPFPGTWNVTLQPQAGQAAYRAAAAPQEQHSRFANVSFTSNTDLTLAGASIDDYPLMGVATDPLVTVDIFGTPRENPTYKGAHQSNPFNLKDAAIKEVYTLGKLPIPYATPHLIRASVVNVGVDTLFGQQVDLLVTGTNSFTDSQLIDTILPGESKYVSFNPYSYATVGNCLVTVSVPNDSGNTNNTKSFNQIITTDVYAYAEPTLPAIGGVGFNNFVGDFIAKFPYSGTNNINQVGVNFFNGGQPYQIVIYDIINDTPGTLLWNSTTQTAVTGNNTVPVIPAVGISGSFFVGVRQTGLTNVSFGYQAEDPIRDQTFYYKSSAMTVWADFASTNSAFRFMVEPRLQVADDLGPESVVLPCQQVILGAPAFNPTVKVLNYGLNVRDTFKVSYEITGPVNSSGSAAFGSVGLNSSQTTTLGLPNLFTPSIPGSYTIKVWTEIVGATDLATGNDTLTSTFEVVDINTATNGGNQLTLNGTNQSATVNGTGSLNITGSMLTIESWINRAVGAGERFIVSKDNDQSPSAYSLLLNASGNLVLRITTISGIDSVVSLSAVPLGVYTHVAATYNGTAGEARVYINGEEVGFKVFYLPITESTTPLYIGRGATAGFFSGSIDELKIWDTTRTLDQLRTGLHTRLSNFAHPNLKAYWRMDESTGSVIADASGNCNAGFMGNGGTFAASEIPLGIPTLYQQPVIASGVTNFAGSDMSLMIYNQSGNNEYYVHKFGGIPAGTQPSFIPGGVTNVHPNNWIVYRYGSGTMDSSEITFFTNGITLAASASDFFLYKRATGNIAGWTLASTATSVDPNTGLATFRAFASDFNNQLVVGANNNPLPVKLLSFKAIRHAEDAKLTWATTSELENAGFDIQRSTDGKAFTTIGFVKGSGTKATFTGYAFTDASIFTTNRAPRIYYRLAQKDLNGKITYSPIVSIMANEQTAITDQVFPNPFTDGLYIETTAQTGSMMAIKVTDMQGQTIRESNLTIQPSGMVDVSELGNLPKGVYFIHTHTNLGNTVMKVVKL